MRERYAASSRLASIEWVKHRYRSSPDAANGPFVTPRELENTEEELVS
jgi:hypothetical protein